MIYKLKTNRVFRSYYGGKRLDEFYGISGSKESTFPEEWIASTVRAFNVGREDIVEGLSVTENGVPLKDIIEADPEHILGKKQYECYGAKTSILVKLLDAAERLFIQCHPTVPFAKEFFGSDFGKTECWYILSADEGAGVYLGFKPGITKKKLKSLFEVQDIDGMLELMHFLPVKDGDVIFVNGGVPHAIGGGCLLCELQEPTDLMVIPERRSKSGITLPDLKMHGGLGFEKMFDCFEYKGYTEEELRKLYVRSAGIKENGISYPVGADLTDRFSMMRVDIKSEVETDLNGSYAVGIVIGGELNAVTVDDEIGLKKGDQLFIGADTSRIKWQGSGTVILCLPKQLNTNVAECL